MAKYLIAEYHPPTEKTDADWEFVKTDKSSKCGSKEFSIVSFETPEPAPPTNEIISEDTMDCYPLTQPDPETIPEEDHVTPVKEVKLQLPPPAPKKKKQPAISDADRVEKQPTPLRRSSRIAAKQLKKR
jgi:hypothetical protein